MPQQASLLQSKSITFSERVTDRLTLSLYNFAHFLVAIVKSLTAITLVWYRAARAQPLVPVLNVPEDSNHQLSRPMLYQLSYIK